MGKQVKNKRKGMKWNEFERNGSKAAEMEKKVIKRR